MKHFDSGVQTGLEGVSHHNGQDTGIPEVTAGEEGPS